MAWIAAAATIASTFMQQQGQKDANEDNRYINEQNNAFNAHQADLNRTYNAEQAGINRDFQDQQAYRQMEVQQYMGNTTYRRAVNDMKEAGLNPMLAYHQGGAPTAGGAAAGGSMAQGSAAHAASPIPMQNQWAAAGQTAAQWAQIGNMMADTQKKEAEAENLRAEQITRDKEGNLDPRTYGARESAKRGDLLHYDALKRIEEVGLTKEQERKVKEEVKEVIERTRNLSVDTKLKEVNEILQRHDIPRMKAEAEYFKSPVGRESPHNKYGPQTPFRLLEGLGERVINRMSAEDPHGARPGRSGGGDSW